MNIQAASTELDWLQRHKHFESLLSDGQSNEALKGYRDLMKQAPDRYDLWANYSSFLYRCGQYPEAVEMAEKSLQIQPSAEGYHNLGVGLKNIGEYEDAIAALKNALKSNPDLTQTHNELAACYEVIRELNYAIDHYQIACTLRPDYAPYWENLAMARIKAIRSREAMSALRQARRLLQDQGGDANNSKIWITYSNCFWYSNDFDITPQLLDEVTTCLHHPETRSEKLTHITAKLWKHQPVIKYLQDIIEDKQIEDFENLLANTALNWPVLAHPVFCGMLERIIIQDPEIEDVLVALRAHFLELAVKSDLGAHLWDEHALSLLSALANQCFLNEYVYSVCADEQENVQALENKIQKGLADVAGPSLYDVAILACYKPLYEIEGASDLSAFQDDKTEPLFRIQYQEPMEENRIKETLETITSIDDGISQLVKQQYEENPYPRWTSYNRFGRKPFNEVMTLFFPHLTENDFTAFKPNAPVRSLIAGCGTGKQVVECEELFANLDILAMDLSASSLSYAIRKTNEAGLENVQFALGDILKLNELDEQFDVVQSTGVLHHMRDPMEGWKILTDLLKPGGFMLIALYSEIARRGIVAAREFVELNGFEATPDGIRACRDEIKALPDGHPVKSITQFSDFCSLSPLRDLIFHVQEHRFTAPMVKKSLEELGLKFTGFHFADSRIPAHYATQYPEDPYGLDLDQWHEYEQANPETFAGMYQFWCQKPDE